MTIVEQLKQTKSVNEALLLLAREIDALKERSDGILDTAISWDEEVNPSAFTAQEASDFQMSINDDATNKVVKVTPALPAQTERRKQYVHQLGFEHLTGQPGVEGTQEELEAAFIVAGPQWLYDSNREYVMGLGSDVRRQMCEDLYLNPDLQDYTNRMARDLMMHRELDPIDTHGDSRMDPKAVANFE